MASGIVPKAQILNTQPRHSDGRFAPVTPHIIKRHGVNRLAGVVMRAPTDRQAGPAVVHIQHEDDARKRIVLK